MGLLAKLFGLGKKDENKTEEAVANLEPNMSEAAPESQNSSVQDEVDGMLDDNQ